MSRQGEGGGHKLEKMSRRRLWMAPNRNSLTTELYNMTLEAKLLLIQWTSNDDTVVYKYVRTYVLTLLFISSKYSTLMLWQKVIQVLWQFRIFFQWLKKHYHPLTIEKKSMVDPTDFAFIRHY